MAGLRILSLNKALEEWGKEETEKFLSTFSCKKNRDVEIYLRSQAIVDEERWKSRTYLIINPDSKRILAFFTISTKYVLVGKCLCISKSKIRKLNADEKGIAQSYLIGQLARADDTNQGLGKDVLKRAISTIRKSSMIVGCRTIRIDCRNSESLIGYYESVGFTDAGANKENDLRQMIFVNYPDEQMIEGEYILSCVVSKAVVPA